MGQILVYPVADCRTESHSYEAFATGFGLTRSAMREFIALYAPDEGTRSEPGLSPLLAPSLAGVAPAFILLAGCDVLRDEGRAYGARLIKDGVETRLVEVRGTIHAFFSMQGLREARISMEEVAAWLAPRW